MSEDKALKTNWSIRPMPVSPKQHIVLPLRYKFSAEEYEKVQHGFIPKQMEDKWFVYFEDNKLYCHRSWTGYCIYIVEFEVSEKGSNVTRVTINRDNKQYHETNNDWDLKFVVYLINVLLLKKYCTYPQKKGVSSEMSALQQWGKMGRAMFGERQNE